MRSMPVARIVPLAAIALLIGIAPAAAGQAAARTPASAQLRARVTGAPVPGTSLSAPAGRLAPAGLPSRKDQIKVLTAVLQNMRENYAQDAGDSPGPQDIFDYGIGQLWRRGIDGAGTTIAVLEGWDYPQIAQQVAGFDKAFGLPDPQITTIYPAGQLPAQCPPGMVALGSYGSCSAWAGELTLDVITAHLIAPYARIVISATPADTQETDDAASQVAMPEMMKAMEVIAGDHLANVISISDGTGESTYGAGKAEITAQNPGELAAAAAGIPVLVGTGDCGVVQNLAVASGQCGDTSAGPDTAAWDDSPWVTAVGGSVPNLSAAGQRLGPDPLWHQGRFGEGAGFSSVFARPGYQDAVAKATGTAMRSVPDITLDSQDGTSESTPMLSGVLALATQLNHGNVGPVNPVLYRVLGPRGLRDGIADVIQGNNSVISGGKTLVQGFTAGKGFDVASGWGTIRAPRFVSALVAATRAAGQDAASRRQARAALARLRSGVSLAPARIPAGGSSYLIAGGFLPGHPVQLSVDGTAVARLTATALGTVTAEIDPAQLGLSPGRHVVSLSSLLITKTRAFRSQ
jgi:antitoxin (DNA-binding transcriptional repressor) of toxin-antitoxin stability system